MTGFKRKKGESLISFNHQDVIPLCAHHCAMQLQVTASAVLLCFYSMIRLQDYCHVIVDKDVAFISYRNQGQII